MPRLNFTSSETFMENDKDATESCSVAFVDYIEGTYDALRTGPDGDELARFCVGENGLYAWELADGRRFSDWSVAV